MEVVACRGLMVRSRQALFHLTGLMVLGLVVLMGALAPAVSAEPVNAFLIGEEQRETSAGTTAKFEWVLYNNCVIHRPRES
jgi:hypothetical protein